MPSNHFNPLDKYSPNLDPRQLTRAAQLAMSDVMSSGASSISGLGGTQYGRENREAATAWYKLISHVSTGKYTARRQIFKVSTLAFVDQPDRPDITAYEVNGYDQIPLGATAVDAMPKFLAMEEGEWNGDIILPFDWLQIQPIFWAKITDATLDAAGVNRWLYDWSEVVKGADGYGAGWGVLTNGRSGTDSIDPLYNSTENMNTGAAAHIEGIGVDMDNLVTDDYSFAIQPCPGNNIMAVKIVKTTAGFEYWIVSYPNGVDGTCAA